MHLSIKMLFLKVKYKSLSLMDNSLITIILYLIENTMFRPLQNTIKKK